MPELPEVERGRKLAESVARGREMVRVECAHDPIVFQGNDAETLVQALLRRRVCAVRRRGKQIWFELDAPPHPLFHFGMSGGFHTRGARALRLKSGPRPDPAWPPRFAKICMGFDDGGELIMTDARRLGRILLRGDPEHEPPISRLGFDPLLDLPSPPRFVELVQARTAVIKSLLLDQRFAAGVGNWIADEALYQSGIDPRRRSSSLSPTEARRLRQKLRSIVRRAVAVNADNDRYPRTWLFHRRWGRRPDATTHRGERVEHITVAGRTTAWVPAAQS